MVTEAGKLKRFPGEYKKNVAFSFNLCPVGIRMVIIFPLCHGDVFNKTKTIYSFDTQNLVEKFIFYSIQECILDIR